MLVVLGLELVVLVILLLVVFDLNYCCVDLLYDGLVRCLVVSFELVLLGFTA